MLSALLLVSLSAAAADLPGVPLTFDVDADGRWVLPEALPEAFAQAGVQPGWALSAVDGQAFEDPLEAQRRVAIGPARNVQLQFDTPDGDTIVLVPRGPMVQVEEVGLLPWPEGFRPTATGWRATSAGGLWLMDTDNQAWSIDPATGAQDRVGEGSERAADLDDGAVPSVWWALSDAPWVTVRTAGLTVGDGGGAREALKQAARLQGFQGDPGDHLAVPTPDGLEIFTVSWPRGTLQLPVCVPDVPETCLVAGSQIARELGERPGGRAEARRALGLACQGGVYRACLESVALDDEAIAERARACVEKDANACHDVARARLRAEPDEPGEVLVGVLEYACAVDASGSLGERLRRLEDVGEGCMLLADAFDTLGVLDRALLSLDQACVLGRAEACEDATRRRADAFALRTVRECEDEDLPLPSACVQLGRLLQVGPISSTELDDFSAFLRACELGDEDGCVVLADYVDRWGITHPRVVAAEKTLLDSCNKEEQRACVGGAHLLVRHDPRSDEYAQALLLFNTACQSGLPSACIAGAEQRRIGAARKVEAPDPITMWTLACDQQSAPGCAGLGERMSRSKRTWPDAYTAWTRACDTGEAGACTDLGRLVENKHDPAWDGEQPSVDYLERGCENGDAEGCFWMADPDVPRKGDPPEPAYLLLERSCDGEYGPACATLGSVHIQRKTSFDDEIAAGKLERACDNGHFESCKDLGEMFLKGKGVEKDRVKAREFAQRYSVNARRRHLRLGAHIGFPYVAGAEGELVLPIPVGPAIAATGSFSYLPGLSGALYQVRSDSPPDDAPDLWYADVGARLYPNNKARGLYVMGGAHRIRLVNAPEGDKYDRQGISGRLGMYNENKVFYTRVEMGIANYGLIDLNDFDEDETAQFPLIQAVLGVSFGIAAF
jgi:uncharacterized protein